MDQTINEMENYRENLQKTYNLLNFTNEENKIQSTPVVPSSVKLENAGINLYVDESGILRCKTIAHANSIKKYLENRDLVKQTKETDFVEAETNLVQGL